MVAIVRIGVYFPVEVGISAIGRGDFGFSVCRKLQNPWHFYFRATRPTSPRIKLSRYQLYISR